MNTKKLETWYLKYHATFPFRETEDPYRIWVSEIMLQQTKLETVIPYYKKFITLFPTVDDLAHAHDDVLKKCVEGIGYYRRFKLMKEAAKVMVETYHGQFPSSYEDVLSLPGIGLYTAGAIMSIAYHQPYSAVDGNVIRIISRQYNLQEDMRLEKHKHLIRDKNQSLIEQANPHIFTQAMMDLGRTICKPKQPLCDQCPIADSCQAYDLGIQQMLPYMSKINKKKEIDYVVLIIHTNKGIILRKRKSKLLEGMYEYPQFESDSINHVIDLLDEEKITIDVMSDVSEYQHIFTHQKWYMHVYHCQLVGAKMADDWQMYTENEIKLLPMATAHRKIRR